MTRKEAADVTSTLSLRRMGDLRGQRRLEECALQLHQQGYRGHDENVISVLSFARTAYQNQAGQKAGPGKQYLVDYAAGKNPNEAVVGADLGNFRSDCGKHHQRDSANSLERLPGFPKRHFRSGRPRATEVAMPAGPQGRYRPIPPADRIKTTRPAASVEYQRLRQLLLRGTVTQTGIPRNDRARDLHCVLLVTRVFHPASLATLAGGKARPYESNSAGRL